MCSQPLYDGLEPGIRPGPTVHEGRKFIAKRQEELGRDYPLYGLLLYIIPHSENRVGPPETHGEDFYDIVQDMTAINLILSLENFGCDGIKIHGDNGDYSTLDIAGGMERLNRTLENPWKMEIVLNKFAQKVARHFPSVFDITSEPGERVLAISVTEDISSDYGYDVETPIGLLGALGQTDLPVGFEIANGEYRFTFPEEEGSPEP